MKICVIYKQKNIVEFDKFKRPGKWNFDQKQLVSPKSFVIYKFENYRTHKIVLKKSF